MKKEISIESWNRKEHYLHYLSFEEPYFGLVANVDCTKTYEQAKEQKQPFFLLYLYKSLLAANSVEAFRYRIEDEKVFCYDQIHASSTIARKDNSFGFSFIPKEPTFEAFLEKGKEEIKAVEESTGLRFNEDTSRIDVIHYSSIPWISFTGLTHARSFGRKGSEPKISFGKYFEEGDKLLLPVSVNVHHGLVDGYHLGLFFESFQDLLNK